MPFHSEDAKELVKILESMLDRFQQSQSVFLIDCGKVAHIGNTVDCYMPKDAVARKIRDKWKGDRRSLPAAGVVFPDNSVLTVQFTCKLEEIPNKLKPVAKEIEIKKSDGEAIGFIESYSYCFYPNSNKAAEIGYFRYDFHIDSMGDGDLGEHSYFHFHRSTEEEFRHATGPMLDFDKIVSGLERLLAPEQRKERLEKTFLEGNFNKLLLDLTAGGIIKLGATLQENKPVWRQFNFKPQFANFQKQFK